MELSSIEIVVVKVKGVQVIVRGVKVTNSTWAWQSKGFKVKIATLISQILLNIRMLNIHR